MGALKALALAVWDRITNEPVLALGLVQAGLALGVAFGLGWNGQQTGATVAMSAAFLSFVARRQVTPA